MNNTQYSLNWQSFQSNICSGLSSFQQNGEFVDMTLAADGHMVKVHQLVMALASPYLKELIANAQCPHPVVYLNNMRHSTLCSILEYIYTGEVLIEAQQIGDFMTAAKGLQIRGLESVGLSGDSATDTTLAQPQASAVKRVFPVSDQDELILPHYIKRRVVETKQEMLKSENPNDFEASDFAAADDDHDDDADNTGTVTKDYTPKPTLQFTVSNRGSLQIILNRYIYNLHSTAFQSNTRRWRCVDYRNQRCSAFVVTKGNVVLQRGNIHSHSFHDMKILAKINAKTVFSAIEDVTGVTKDEQNASKKSTEDSFDE